MAGFGCPPRDEGALAVARANNILLRTYREASQLDWVQIVGPNAWTFLTKASAESVTALVLFEGQATEAEAPLEAQMQAEDGTELPSLGEMVRDSLRNSLPDAIGDLLFTIEGQDDRIGYVRDGTWMPFVHCTARVHLVASTFPINLQFAAGHIYEDVNSGQRVYAEMHSQGFDWRDIVTNGTGIVLTPEQYVEQRKGANLSVNIVNAKRFLRVVVQVGDNNLT